MNNNQIMDNVTIKWILELCGQERYQKPSDVIKAYKIKCLGC